jgi:hypothetical protein
MTIKNYENISTSIDKSSVIAFEKIIQDWKKKLLYRIFKPIVW